MRTVLEWVDWAAQRFDGAGLYYGHGTDNSRDEAAWLVLHAIGASPCQPFIAWHDEPKPDDAREIERLVDERIEKRCPAAYLTGTAWFAGFEFEVSPDVLVPRSPVAQLIGEKFTPWLNAASPLRILDMGTGSGCIAIACALRFPDAQVTAVDISEAALAVAGRNVRRHDVGKRVKLVHSDLFDSLEPEKYDLIVSNPPYVPAQTMGALPGEYLAEPEVGLFSGREGLEIPLRILQGAPVFLAPNGILVCEVGESQERLEQALPEVPFLWLEFEAGGSGVFLLEAGPLDDASRAAEGLLKEK